MAHALTASASLAAAAAAPHEFSSAPARPTAVGFDDEEFPYPSGLLNGVKCCTKCGATKTPQWREGPYGERRRRQAQAATEAPAQQPPCFAALLLTSSPVLSTHRLQVLRHFAMPVG